MEKLVRHTRDWQGRKFKVRDNDRATQNQFKPVEKKTGSNLSENDNDRSFQMQSEFLNLLRLDEILKLHVKC